MLDSENTIEASKEFLDINNNNRSLSTPNKFTKVDTNNNCFKQLDQNQYENKENNENCNSTPKLLKRKLKESNISNEPNDKSLSLSNSNKKFKREPFKEINNDETLEVAQCLVELSNLKNNVVNNKTLDQSESNNEICLKIACESDISAERSVISIARETVEKVTIQHYDELIPQIVSSTPTKTSLNEQGLEEELLNICRETGIQIVENSNRQVDLTDVYEELDTPVINNESAQIESSKIDIKYDDDDNNKNNEEDEAVPKKLKIKMNFKKKNDSSPNQSEDKTETEAKRKKESAELAFTIDCILNTFTEDEIRNGVFPDKKNMSKSKTRVPIGNGRVNELKNLIRTKFNLDEIKINDLWDSLRAKLNVRLHNLVKTKKFQKKFLTN